jgi:hypothetical protein
MASDARSTAVTALLALGAAAFVWPWLPGAWPMPLPQGPLDEASIEPLAGAAAALDAACANGDAAAFAGGVTAAHRDRLERDLAAVERGLDAATLRALGAQRELRYADWLRQPLLLGEVRGDRAVVAVRRPRGDGAQVLAFVWDGAGLRLDAAWHAASAGSRAAAGRAVDAAFAR